MTNTRLLIVDDNWDNRALLIAVFKRLRLEGVDVLEACTGDEALAIAIREKPALILLDVMMPGLSGFEVCRRVKSDAALAGTHIILITASDSPEARKQAVLVGADGFIPKPFDVQLLREQVRAVLEPRLTPAVPDPQGTSS